MCADKPTLRRLFVGLALTDQEKTALGRIQNSLAGVRWTSSENLHMTLSFIGAIDEKHLPRIHEVLHALRLPSFSRRCKGVGWWENGILWASMIGGEGLHHMKRAADDALSFLNLPSEKRVYFPHVTLARCKTAPPRRELKAWLNAYRQFETTSSETKKFELFESITTAGETRYAVLHSYRSGNS
jgi:RNA 2',3'-cyclic 3'-phosphodiesterase